MNTVTPINYNSYNLSFRGLSPVEICSKLCKGACCDHSTVMSMPLKRATDRLMGEFFKSSLEQRETLPLKRVVYSWGLDTQDARALELNNKINELLAKLQEATSKDQIIAITNKINELNARLASLIDNTAELFLPITNATFKDDPAQAVISKLPNVCMYKDPKTNKCSIYYGLITPEGETIHRPKPCVNVGSDMYPCPWLNPEKLGETVAQTRATFAKHGYRLPEDVIVRYIAEQHNLNDTWREVIYKSFLKSKGIDVNDL